MSSLSDHHPSPTLSYTHRPLLSLFLAHKCSGAQIIFPKILFVWENFKSHQQEFHHHGGNQGCHTAAEGILRASLGPWSLAKPSETQGGAR